MAEASRRLTNDRSLHPVSQTVASYLLDAQIGNCLVLIHYCLVPILLRAALVYS